MPLPDDDEMTRILQALGNRDPQMYRGVILDPSQPLTLGNVLHGLREIVQGGFGSWTLTPEAQEWVREHGIDITPEG